METRRPNVFSLILSMIVSLGLGAIIVLILNILNHGGWFAFISGLIGAIFFFVRVFPKILSGSPQQRRRFYLNNEIQPEGVRRATIAAAYKSILLCGLLGVIIGVGIYFIPSQYPVFTLITALLGLCFCACLVAIGLSVLVLFLAHRERIV